MANNMNNHELQQFNNVDYHTNQMNTYYDRLVNLGGFSNMAEHEVNAFMNTNRANVTMEMQHCFDTMELHAYIRDSFDLEDMTNDYPNYRNHFYDLLIFVIKHRTTLSQELIFMTIQFVENRVAGDQ
jgi:hypothetical protein